MSAKIPTNPLYYGSMWILLHLKAKNASTLEAKNSCIDDIHLLSVEFPCGNCRNHIQEYLKSHPFDKYMNLKNEKGEDVGMFKWFWEFHNAVNVRIGKPFVSWDNAWQMYDTGNQVCTNCSVENGTAANSFEDSFEEKGKKKELPKSIHTTKPGVAANLVDKKKMIQNYFKKGN